LPGEGGQLCIERAGADALRLSIEEHDPDPEELHRMALARLESRTMRAAADLSPHPCWQIDDSGRVLWAN
jgi:PAS domain-containing protein